MQFRTRGVILVFSIICFLFTVAGTVLGQPDVQSESPTPAQTAEQQANGAAAQQTDDLADTATKTAATTQPAAAQSVSLIPPKTDTPVATEPRQTASAEAKTASAVSAGAKTLSDQTASAQQAKPAQATAAQKTPDAKPVAPAKEAAKPATQTAKPPVRNSTAASKKPAASAQKKTVKKPVVKTPPAPKKSPGLLSRIVTATKGLVSRALGWLGTRYVWGGASTKGVDCSGLTQLLYKSEGVKLPHNAKAQYKLGKAVARAALAPGDLVFFNTRGPLTHVGIYIGNNKFIHAANPKRGVRVDSLGSSYYNSRYAGARRYKNFG